jgi:hypothetical protein
MNMVKIVTRFECLRCGHVEKPTAPKSGEKVDASGPAISRTAFAAANWPSG